MTAGYFCENEKFMHPSDIIKVHQGLSAHYGALHWWPGESTFEIIVGAILTQNTAWPNVEKAIRRLNAQQLLSPLALHHAPIDRVAECLRPSGYFNIKTKRLKAFLDYLIDRHGGSLERLFQKNLPDLRRELLQIKGIGPETADAILCYAGNKPVFVVDAYTKRIFTRHGLFCDRATYDEIQQLFLDNLPKSVTVYNEFHAQIVMVGKDYCHLRRPRCESCPINLFGRPPEHETN